MVRMTGFPCWPWVRNRLSLALGPLVLAFCFWASPVPAAEQSVPVIPGITTPDNFPGGCVDCHIRLPERNMDVRLSTRMKKWRESVDPQLLARIGAVSPKTVTLTGRHPPLPEQSYRNIPGSCMACHGKSQTKIPAMAPMLHALHLIGGKENHFITEFQGACTHCHKFDARTAKWSIPSGAEK